MPYRIDPGLTTIEDVRERVNKSSYQITNIMTRIMLKAWYYHSESRNRNGNLPFTFDNYTKHMTDKDYLEQVELNMLDCQDIGGKDEVVNYLRKRIHKHSNPSF